MNERPILCNGPMVRAILNGSKTQTRRVVKPGPSQKWLSYSTLQRSPRAKPVMIDAKQWAQFAHPKAGLTINGMKYDDWSPLTCIACPMGAPGDRLWVRETCRAVCLTGGKCGVRYMADDAFAEPNQNMTQWESWADEEAWHKLHGYRGGNGLPVPSIHMPRWACRIVLEVVSVRVERLQDISEDDARAEGLKRLTKDRGVTYKYGMVDRDGLPGNDDDGWHWKEWDVDSRVAFRKLWDSIYGTWDANPWVWVVEFRRVDDNESEATTCKTCIGTGHAGSVGAGCQDCHNTGEVTT
jgi:hypothetical protein